MFLWFSETWYQFYGPMISEGHILRAQYDIKQRNITSIPETLWSYNWTRFYQYQICIYHWWTDEITKTNTIDSGPEIFSSNIFNPSRSRTHIWGHEMIVTIFHGVFMAIQKEVGWSLNIWSLLAKNLIYLNQEWSSTILCWIICRYTDNLIHFPYIYKTDTGLNYLPWDQTQYHFQRCDAK